MTAIQESVTNPQRLRSQYENTVKNRCVQPQTERVKQIDGSEPTDSVDAWNTTLNLWNMANTIDGMTTPLVQHRAILRASAEPILTEHLCQLQKYFRDYATVSIPGCIPYRLDGEDYGIYYLHIESPHRRRYMYDDYSQNINHETALELGLRGRDKPPKRLPENIKIATITGVNGQIAQVCESEPIDISEEELIDKLIAAHRESFAFPHDKNQRRADGLKQMLHDNPMVVAFDEDKRNVAGVGLLEIDERFRHGNIALIEPTYFTDPEYREHGISRELRKQTQRLFEEAHPGIYAGRSVLAFNESIRNTSFGISIASGCRVPVGYSGDFDGNLGDAYTYIGPAGPASGLMPMGLTYHGNNNLLVQM